MVRQTYFLSKTENEANLCDNSVDFRINSSGIEYFYAPFKSQSSRYDYSFVYVFSGQINFCVNGKNFSLKSGNFMIIPPQKQVYYGTDENFLNYYWLQFTGAKANYLLEKTKIETEKIYQIEITDEIKNAINGINAEFMTNDDLFDLAASHRLVNFFVTLSRTIYCPNEDLLSSVKYIHKHYDQDISVKFLASLENLSISHYRKVFSKKYGLSPKKYLINLRINAVCHYLTVSDLTFSEIAEKTGFKDVLYLSKFFHKKIGVSMSQYKKGRTSKAL